MGTCEITNRQFRQFDPGHTSRYYTKRQDQRGDDKGIPLDSEEQPAIRVSWNRAMEYCEWLAEKTGLHVTLPTEAQWIFAARAGMGKGAYEPGGDFSAWENFADYTFATYGYKGKSLDGHFQVAEDSDLISAEGVDLADRRYDDQGCVTMPVGSYQPNSLGLYDMLGNAAEWTLTDYGSDEKTVKGGSFLDRPERCTPEIAHGYPAWQNVYNAGFRIVVTEDMSNN
jgi:formylglycine-generating enzyme required for sulfatase activity